MKSAILIALIICTGCATSAPQPWAYNRAEIERHCMESMQVYVKAVEYDVCVVSSQEEVNDKHQEFYGAPTDVIAFYAALKKVVVVQRGCDIRVLRHEIGHAIHNQYFKRPVPRWMAEVMAQRCEGD